MSSSDRFKPVQRIVASREQSAARSYGDSRKTCDEEENKLQNLKDYHKEYLERFQQAAAQGISASQLHEYQAFFNKLETAINEQEERVRLSRANCTEQKGIWQEKHIRTRVIDNAVERMQQQEQQHREKLEQKDSDERSQRIGKKH